MEVTAKAGTRCPKEGNPREHIGDIVPVSVPDTAYYRRLVAEGSLVEVPTKKVDVPNKKTVKREEQKVKEDN